MTPQKRKANLLLVVLVLALAALACGTGYQTSKKIVGNSGEVRVRMKEASGASSTEVEINEDWFRERVTASVTLSLEAGSCQATLLGEEGTKIILNAAAGSPSKGNGNLVTDGFGEVTLETNCQGGQNMDLLIEFSR
jgi:hypothetical protein